MFQMFLQHAEQRRRQQSGREIHTCMLGMTRQPNGIKIGEEENYTVPQKCQSSACVSAFVPHSAETDRKLWKWQIGLLGYVRLRNLTHAQRFLHASAFTRNQLGDKYHLLFLCRTKYELRVITDSPQTALIHIKTTKETFPEPKNNLLGTMDS